ncbi:UDP-GlcNAc:betaGal beta-1,3-N-acetylglucosaminyltransferase-like protein 1 isoform X7 [Cavia porcellus]|uniref:UDP-GlcNAc:betaGal beta-1,3-N-acetylglucosaminyltransferase-like protein 1 isoform X7 n=1 Tax=Cavia porcellus TaxID=10141 RepID=UPI002FE05980
MQQQRDKIPTINQHFTVITINVNGLNAPIKRNRLAEWIKKQNPTICCLQETHLTQKDTHRLKVKGWKTILHAAGIQKKAGVAILFADNVNFKPTITIKDKEGHYILVRGKLQEEEITILNIYAPNSRAPSYIKQLLTEMKTQIISNTIVTGDLNTPLTPRDRSTRQKMSEEITELNHTCEQMGLIDIYRMFHPTTSEYTFFSAVHGSFSKIDHILAHRTYLNKCKRAEIIPCMLSDHSALKLEINDKRYCKNPTNTWKLNNTILSNQWVTEEIKEEIKQYLKENENADTTSRNLWDAMKAVLRGKFIVLSSHIRKTERIQINNLMLHLKQLEKEEQVKPKAKRREEIIKIRAEINAIETKKTIQRINKSKSWFFERVNKIDKPLANLI